MIRRITIVLLICVIDAGIHSASSQSTEVASPNLENERLSRLVPFFEFQAPLAEGPHSVVVMVSGCSGFHAEPVNRSYDRDADRLLAMGYAVIRTDYVRAHGLQNSCTGAQNPTGETVPAVDIARYIETTIAYLDNRADIDQDRVYILGSSLGGAGVFTAMADDQWDRRQELAAVISYFPVCQAMNPWTAEVPLLLLLAELDNIQPAQYCRDLVGDSPARALIQVIEYPQAHHCFNTDGIVVVTEARADATCAANPEASEASWNDVQAFLKQH